MSALEYGAELRTVQFEKHAPDPKTLKRARPCACGDGQLEFVPNQCTKCGRSMRELSDAELADLRTYEGLVALSWAVERRRETLNRACMDAGWDGYAAMLRDTYWAPEVLRTGWMPC